MKIRIEVPNAHIDGALAEPHSRYWASEARWVPRGLVGHVVDAEDCGKRYALNASKLKKALEVMAEKYPLPFAKLKSGDYDGPIGDLLLQLIAFGEVRYG